jgi:uncharacterized membrane protein
MFAASEYAGPIPPPAMLREFNEIVPNGAERIFKMAESQAQHRQSLESHVITSDARRAWGGLIAAFILTGLLISVGGYLIATNHDSAGATIITGTVVALATTFITAHVIRRGEREKKAETAARVGKR